MAFGGVIRYIAATTYDCGGDGDVIWAGHSTTLQERSVVDLSQVRYSTKTGKYLGGCGGSATEIWAGDRTGDLLLEYSVVDLSQVQSAAAPGNTVQGMGGGPSAVFHYDVGVAKIYEYSPVDLSIVRGPINQPYTGQARIGGKVNRVWWCDNAPDRVAELSYTDFSGIRSASSPRSIPAGIGGDYEHIYHFDAVVPRRLYELDPGLIPGTCETYAPADVRHNQVIAQGSVTDVGDTSVLEYGFEWGETAAYGESDTEVVEASAGFVGEFTMLIEGLTQLTTYHIRAKARDATGWFYGNDIEFMTVRPFPITHTYPPTAVTADAGTLNGNITSTGGDASCTKRGFVWGRTSKGDPGDTAPASSDYDDYWEEEGAFATSVFDHALEDLPSRVIFYFRAYSYNSHGYDYGFQVKLFTSEWINLLIPTTDVLKNVRFDSSGRYPRPNTGIFPHYLLVSGEDASFTPGTFGYYGGNYIYEANWYNSLMKTDLFTLSNPTNRTEDVVKVKWKAKTFRNSYPYGNYQRVLRTHSVTYEGTKTACSPNGWKCEIFYDNPNTSAAWTIAELDSLAAGIALGESGGWGRPMCDKFQIQAFWRNAEARTDGVDYLGGGDIRLNGHVIEDELEACEVYFEWGITDAYGNSTTPQSKAWNEDFHADITNDVPIHYRAVIETACGETFYGDDEVWGGEEYSDRIYVYLGTQGDPLQHEFTAPANSGVRGVLAITTEIGWDEELQQASAGICQLTLDNHNGDYSPEKASGEYFGVLELGKYITVFEIFKGVRYNHFVGRIEDIEPHAEKDNQVAFILAVDGMDDLNQLEINTVLRTDTEVGELAADALDAAAWPAGGDYRDLDTGSDVLQLGWFHKTKALAGFRLLEEIEHGRFYISRDGKATLENRHARLLGDGLVSQGDFEDTMFVIAYKWSKRLVRNQITVRGRRYYIGGAMLWSGYDLAEITDELIWSAFAGGAGAVYIPQATPLTLWAEFNVPLASYDTLVAGTHWNANTEADKSGVDVTANVSLVQTRYGQSVKLVFTNNGSQGAYLVVPDSPPSGAPTGRTVLVYGVLYAEEVMAIMEEDATSRDAYGKRSLEIDAKFKSNPNDILAYAQFMLASYKDALPRAASLKHVARKDYPDDTIRVQCLARHISDRITLKSTLLGFDQDYFINKVVQDYLFQEAGMIHETTWSVERAEGAYEGVFWLLGVVGFSELGETTMLGF